MRAMPPAKVVPGNHVIYTITAHNQCSKPVDKVVVNNPVPEHLSYVADSATGPGTEISYSVDGRVFGKPGALMVKEADGSQRPARDEDIRSIRWVFTGALAPGHAARPAVRIQMLEKIYSLQLGQHNTEGMVEVLKQLNELRPGNATYISRLNYLRLVSGVELEPAYDGVLGASARDVPTEASDVAPALLRALVALRFGDSEALKREVAAISDPDGMPAGQRAVVAGLYHLTGRDVEGFRLAEKVPPSLLIDGEKRFLRRSIR